ncbi:MAG: hypothetical protein D6681_14555 [Calditrichaeota bacterium]|nr:MAG: hypothetical protein D6681_14555 [Calditrichota bacterium]
MFNWKTVQQLALAVAISGAIVLSSGCTRHPNEKQIREMEETRQAALSAEQKLEELRSQRKQLEDEVARKKQEKQRLDQEKAAVEQRLQNWEGNN